MKRFTSNFLPEHAAVLTDETTTTSLILMDQSGSMRHIKSAALQAFSAYVDNLFKDVNAAKMFIGMLGFNAELTEIAPIQSALSFTRFSAEQYIPNGCTWLYRRMADALEMLLCAKAEGRLRGHLVLTVFTDGRDKEEGAMGEASLTRLKALIEKAAATSWLEIHIHGISDGDSQLAGKIAEKIGLDPSHATTVTCDAIHETMHAAAQRLSMTSASVIAARMPENKFPNIYFGNKPARGVV